MKGILAALDARPEYRRARRRRELGSACMTRFEIRSVLSLRVLSIVVVPYRVRGLGCGDTSRAVTPACPVALTGAISFRLGTAN